MPVCCTVCNWSRTPQSQPSRSNPVCKVLLNKFLSVAQIVPGSFGCFIFVRVPLLAFNSGPCQSLVKTRLLCMLIGTGVLGACVFVVAESAVTATESKAVAVVAGGKAES